MQPVFLRTRRNQPFEDRCVKECLECFQLGKFPEAWMVRDAEWAEQYFNVQQDWLPTERLQKKLLRRGIEFYLLNCQRQFQGCFQDSNRITHCCHPGFNLWSHSRVSLLCIRGLGAPLPAVFKELISRACSLCLTSAKTLWEEEPPESQRG